MELYWMSLYFPTFYRYQVEISDQTSQTYAAAFVLTLFNYILEGTTIPNNASLNRSELVIVSHMENQNKWGENRIRDLKSILILVCLSR